MITVWLDPGKLTGVAVYEGVADSFYADEYDYARTGSFLENCFSASPGYEGGIRLGWESFTITAKTAQNSQAPWSLEVIGIARYLAWKYDVPVLQEARPGDRDVITPNLLRACGVYGMLIGKKDALSAAQHCVAYLLRSKQLPQRFKEAILGEIDE
jgi:hypothetical protein